MRKSQEHFRKPQEHGAALLAVLALGFLMTLSVAAFLGISTSHARTGRYSIDRIQAQRVAEGALWYAYAFLIDTPAYPGGTQTINVPTPTPTNPSQTTPVTVTISAPTSGTRSIQSTIVYQTDSTMGFTLFPGQGQDGLYHDAGLPQ